MTVKKVLVTGVYGLIGGEVYLSLLAQPDLYEVYGLSRRRYPSDRSSLSRNLDIPDNRFYKSDMSDLDEMIKVMQDIDIVVHMAADPRQEAPWESILKSNIIGTKNIYEAAVTCGVKRVIYASSVMVSWGYFDDEPYKSIFEGRYDDITPGDIPIVLHTWPTRPTADYPASKVWGEGMGWYYAHRKDLSVICLRIGGVNDEDYPHTESWAQAVFCSKRDVVQIVEKSIVAPEDLRFDIFYGVSNNKWNWVDIQHARDVINYDPQDRGEDLVR